MNIGKFIKSEFEEKKRITLEDLYFKLKEYPEITLEDRDLRHRIRSVIWNLKNKNFIEHIGEAEYCLNESN